MLTSLNTQLRWFYVNFGAILRQGKQEAFEVLMFLCFAHFFKVYNPKELADYLGIASQHLYRHLKGWSLYQVRKLLLDFMVYQAAERLRALQAKSAPTRSRAEVTLSGDNSVIDRVGRMLRYTWSWYSGNAKKVVSGQDLLGVVLTIEGVVFPLHLVFCSKQGSATTDKPSLLLKMLQELKEAFQQAGIDLTAYPLTLDSWYVSQELREAILELGFTKLIVAGKGNYVFTIAGEKQPASDWKKTLELSKGWGLDVPAKRVQAISPTFGKLIVLFYKKTRTRNYYLMNFGKVPLRAAELWHIWRPHVLIEHFWKLLKSTFKIKEMRLQGDGIYVGLLVKILAYLLAIRITGEKSAFSDLSLTQLMRKFRRNFELRDLMLEHFHLPKAITQAATAP